MSMEQLRQGAQNINSGKGGKGPQRSSFYARLKLPGLLEPMKRFIAAPPNEESIVQVAEPIVLIPGQYRDYYSTDADGNPLPEPPIVEAFRFRAHTFSVYFQPRNQGQRGYSSFRDITCSAGPNRHAPQPCVGCYQVDHGAKDSKAKDQWAFNVAHLAWYHNMPLLRDGQVVPKKDNSGPVLVKNECLSYKMENVIIGRANQARVIVQPKNGKAREYRQCEGCGGQHPYVFGDHRTIQVGFKHLKSIMAIDDELGKKCANCGTFVLLMYFNCGNENCNARIVDISQTGWTNDQIAQFSKSEQQCSHCGFRGRPYAEYKCGFDERFFPMPGAGCQGDIEPRKTSIFDNVLWLQREGDGTESDIVVKKYEPIATYKTQDGRPLSEHLKEIVRAPFNLEEMYAPDTLDDQAETLRIQNPYAQQQQQYQGYPQQQQYQQQPAYPPQAPGAYQPQPQQGYGPQGGQQQPMYPNMPMPGRPNFGK